MSQQTGIAQWRQYPFWARGPARIVGDPIKGEVVMDEKRAEQYHMFATKDLSFALAALAYDVQNIDAREVRAFVKRYGLLWHGAEDVGEGKCRESLMNWWYESKRLATLMRLYADLKTAVRTGTTLPLRSTMDEFLSMFEAAPPEANDQTLMEQASVYLAEAVTVKLEGCSVGITSTTRLSTDSRRPDRFLITHASPNLLTAAYVHFAQTIVDQALIKECPGCGRMFVPESGKQKYCTKSCASTNRWRRWKNRQAEE